mgnify:FL=1
MAKEKIKKPTKTELKKISDSLKKSGTKKEVAFNTKDVMKWLFDGGSTEVPVIFMKNNTTLKNHVKNIAPKFRTIPRIMNLFNNHLNKLYDKRTGAEILEFLKSYIQQHKINIQWLDNNWYKKDQRELYLSHHLGKSGNLETSVGDLTEEYQMFMTGAFNDKKEILSKWFQVFEDPNAIEEDFKENVNELLLQMDEKKHDNDPRFLKEVNQEIVDELELSLIDIKMIEKMNKILLVFIDKNNNKKYSLIPFSYEFVISTINAIKYNDYVVNFDPAYHNFYVCFDFATVEKIRMAINKSKDKFFKKYAWL